MEKSTKITRPAKCSMKGLREEKNKRRKMVVTGPKRYEYSRGGGYEDKVMSSIIHQKSRTPRQHL